MIGTKKKSLLVILSLVMVLALSCSAWAATVGVRANGIAANVTQNIVTTDEWDDGALAQNGGTITNPGYSITTSGNSANGVRALTGSLINTSGNISTTGYAYGVFANNNGSRINASSTNVTSTYDRAFGVVAQNDAIVSMDGTVTTQGLEAHGVKTSYGGYVVMNGVVTTSGEAATGLHADQASSIDFTGSITTSGARSNGAYANFAEVTVNGNVTVNGINSYGLQANGINGETAVNMNSGTLTVADESSSGIKLENEGIVNLTNVTADADTLLMTSTSGTLNAEDSTLVGDVIHGGIGGAAETLEVNLKDSTLEGAILTSPGIGNLTGGVVDLDLENSTWFITGDSSTNGKVTGDINSAIDYTEAPGETTVTIDEIVGNPTITLKPGDQLNITNSTGNNGDFSTSNPDVLEIVTDPDTGAVSIISKGEGDADLTYSYTAPDGSKHTVTVDGSSADPNGTGSTPGGSRSGGSSSGCNAGFGALFALLGLAIVAKKK